MCKDIDGSLYLSEDEIIRDFEKGTHTLLDAEKQVTKEDREKEWFLEK